MLDCVIKGGLVVDGTGAPPVTADVGILDGRIVSVGEDQPGARRSIDAGGLVVAPGFIDVHTHYDPHLTWDPAVTPSSLNGVTTVFGGNCGFSLAPITPEAAAYLVPMLARVEGMPLESLEACVDLEWSDFDSWYARLDGTLAVNAGFLAGHSTIRRVVMGEAAVGSVASPAQLDAMVELLHQALAHGAMGFSTTRAGVHKDQHGDPVPSSHATVDEVVALSSVVREHPGTTLEITPSSRSFFEPGIGTLLGRMSAAGQRPLNWNLLSVRDGPDEAEARASRLRVSDIAAELGGRVYALSIPEPTKIRNSLLTGLHYGELPEPWPTLMRLPPAERVEAFARPDLRAPLRSAAAAHPYQIWTDWENSVINDVQHPALASVVGRRIGDLVPEHGVDAFDAFLNISVTDGLQTGVRAPITADDDEGWNERRRLWADRRVIVGGSDAGAHLDVLGTFACYARFMGEAVRRRGLLSLADAVHLVTEVPARLYGVRDRGRVQAGYYADLNIFDPDRIDAGLEEARADLPAGGWRIYGEAVGIEHTFVNGVEIARSGALTGLVGGRLIRSGRDTETVGVVQL